MAQRTSQSRPLWIGFGGLLVLLAVAGVYGLSAVRAIDIRNKEVRSDFVLRNRILQQLRADLYLSGTHVRDLLLESDTGQAALQRQAFAKTRGQIDANCAAYASILQPGERVPFRAFTVELDRYFEALRPALSWSDAERRALGLAFMKQSLLPERMLAVKLADQLSEINSRQLEEGNRQMAKLFGSFRLSLAVFTVFSLTSGALLAGFSMRRLLQLERISTRQVQELSHLSSRVVQVQESERRAISRELHDEVGQAVSGLLLGIGNVAATLPADKNPQAIGQLQDLRGLAERTVAVVRNLSLLLRPSMLDDLGLIPALQWQAREVGRTANVSVQVFADAVDESRVSDEAKTCIYRVVQEALTNVTRHARATAVEVHLSNDHEGLRLSVRDNGSGFTPQRNKGLGILGMEERVRHLNGALAMHSEAGRGTTVEIRLPV